MADKNYLKQTQGDADSADALKHTTVIDVTITSANDRRVGPYYPGNAKSIFIATTGNCKFQIRGSGGTGGLAATEFRDLVLTSEASTAIPAKVGHLDTGAIPHEFYLLDTSSSDNPVTMYINY